MKKLTAFLLLLPVVASADTSTENQWLCTAEKVTTIYLNEKGEVEAYAFDSDQKFFASEDGLKIVGRDDYHFSADDCKAYGSPGIDCNLTGTKASDKGFFDMAVTQFGGEILAVFNHYQIVWTGVFVAQHTHYLGHCEKL